MLKLRRMLLLALVSLVAALPRGTTGDESGPSRVLALVGGRVLTQGEAGEFEGTVLVRDGRVEAVGAEVEVPEGAERVDVSGLTVTPGLIDARSVLWLPPESRRDGSNDGALNILDGVDPYAEDWRDVARSGVTAIAVQPSSSGLFGGRGAVLRVGPGGSVEGLAIGPDAYVQAALGLNNASANSILRYRQFEQLKRSLDGVKRYKEEWEKYEEAKQEYDEQQAKAREDEGKKETKGEDESKGGESKDDADDSHEPEAKGEGESKTSDPETKDEDAETPTQPPKEPERDETREFLVKLLEGEVPLRIEAHREDDVRNAFALAEEFGLKLIVEGLSDPRSAREELVRHRTPMVLGPILERGSVPSYRRNRDRNWPADLLADDSRWALGTYGEQPADSALLRAHAAAAVARGVLRDRVLRAMTSGAAEVLGLADELGTIAEGRRADLVAFAGDPLDPAAPVALVVSGGEIVYRNPDATPSDEAQAQPVSVVDVELPDRLPRRFVLRSRRLLGPDGTLGPGSIEVADGLVAASGESVEAEGDTPAFDVGDAVVTPGLLSAQSTLGQGRAAAEAAGADAGFLRAVDAFDPTGRAVRELVRGGVLRAGFAPASVNVIAGAVGAVRLGAAEPVVDPVIGMGLVLSGSSRDVERHPASLPGQLTLVREFLGLEGSADPGVRRTLDYYLSGPVIDRLDVICRERADRLRNGESAAFFEVDGPTEVGAALDLAEELGIRVAIVGPGAIEEHADRVARLAGGPGLILILRPMDPGPEASRRMASVVEAAGSGARVLFAAEDPEELRLLAATAVAEGLPRAEALRSLAGGFSASGLTVADAPDRPWQAGAPADFVVWDGSPVDLASRPIAVVVDGRFVP